MRLATLQQYLRSLSTPLAASGASQKILGDIEKTCAAMEPFKDSEFEQVALLLQQADEYRRTGVLPFPPKKPSKPATPKAPPVVSPAVAELAQHVRRLEEQACSPDVKREQLEAQLDKLNLTVLGKNDLVALARELGAAVNSK